MDWNKIILEKIDIPFKNQEDYNYLNTKKFTQEQYDKFCDDRSKNIKSNPDLYKIIEDVIYEWNNPKINRVWYPGTGYY